MPKPINEMPSEISKGQITRPSAPVPPGGMQQKMTPRGSQAGHAVTSINRRTGRAY